jgi:CheY-like chemotaxis protein
MLCSIETWSGMLMDGRFAWPLLLTGVCLVLAVIVALVGYRRARSASARSRAKGSSASSSRPFTDSGSAARRAASSAVFTALPRPDTAEAQATRAAAEAAAEAVIEAAQRERGLRAEKHKEFERQTREPNARAERAADPRPIMVASERTASIPKRHAAAVMIVDDSKVVRVKTGRLLVHNEFKVSLATDGVDAVHQLRSKLPDVLILDVDMPGLNGFEVTRLLRSNPDTAQLPIIMITSAEERYREEAMRSGADVLLGKPYSEEAMIEHIRHALRRRSAPLSVAA